VLLGPGGEPLELALVEVPVCAPAVLEPVLPMAPELPDWSMPEELLVALLPELPDVPVPMLLPLVALPLLPVGLPDWSVAVPEP
jgi:hypothetical protein